MATSAAGQHLNAVLRWAVARNHIQCIAMTTAADYRTLVRTDSFLARHFAPIFVSPMSREDTLEILRGLRQSYEEHRHVQITDDALEAAVDLSETHLPDSAFPGKA